MQVEQALVVPAVIVIVQILKPIIKPRDNYSGLIALIIAFIGTAMVSIYSMTEEAFNQIGTYSFIKLIVECSFSAIATWLSASKIYDLVYGDKKWDAELVTKLQSRYVKGVSDGTTAVCGAAVELNKPDVVIVTPSASVDTPDISNPTVAVVTPPVPVTPVASVADSVVVVGITKPVTP
jgi:hypothetical protein